MVSKIARSSNLKCPGWGECADSILLYFILLRHSLIYASQPALEFSKFKQSSCLSLPRVWDYRGITRPIPRPNFFVPGNQREGMNTSLLAAWDGDASLTAWPELGSSGRLVRAGFGHVCDLVPEGEPPLECSSSGQHPSFSASQMATVWTVKLPCLPGRDGQNPFLFSSSPVR